MKNIWGGKVFGKIDERTKAVAQAGDALALRILLYALLVDVIYRSVYLKDPSWDIMGLIVAGGLISYIYQITHRIFESKARLIGFIVFTIVLGAALGFTLVKVVLPLIR